MEPQVPDSEPSSTIPVTPPEPAILVNPAPPTAAAPEPVTTSDPVITGSPPDAISPAEGSSTPPPPVSIVGPARRSKKSLFIALVIVLILLLGGGYVFGFYIPNQSSNVYKTSLVNSGKAIDQLITYANDQKKVQYKSYNLNADFKFTSGAVSGDGTLVAKINQQGVGDAKLGLDLAGEKLTANVRSVKSSSSYPDIYLQVSGVKNLLDSEGLNSLDSLDGKWVVVDHTLLESGAANLKQSAMSGTTSNAGVSLTPSRAQAVATANQLNAVNKQYIFTTDSSKAVLTKQKFIGKETKASQSVNHYKVGYNKAHLTAYVNALKGALDASPLNDAAKKADGGKNLSDQLDLASLNKNIASAPSNYSFDLWANTKTKLVQSVQFTDPKDSRTSFTLSQNYTGGSKYPFSFAINANDGTGTLAMTLDTKTNVVSLKGNLSATGADALTAQLNLTFTPTMNTITETAPSGAQPLTNVLGQLLAL